LNSLTAGDFKAGVRDGDIDKAGAAIRRVVQQFPAQARPLFRRVGLVPMSSMRFRSQLRRIASTKTGQSFRCSASAAKSAFKPIASRVRMRSASLRKSPFTISPRILCATRVNPV
jgi:hypothetical protein